MPPPSSTNALQTSAQSGRLLSPLVSHHTGAVQSLSNICLNLLVSPTESSELPPFLDYDWVPPDRGAAHPLLDVSILHDMVPAIQPGNLSRILQGAKSAGDAYARNDASESRGSHFSPSHSGSNDSTRRSKFNPFPLSHRSTASDDASENPYFCPCPSPRHLEYDLDVPYPRPSRRLYLNPAEERIEWREVFGNPELPVKWIGCSPGCLHFLEEDDDDWGLDDDEREE